MRAGDTALEQGGRPFRLAERQAAAVAQAQVRHLKPVADRYPLVKHEAHP